MSLIKSEDSEFDRRTQMIGVEQNIVMEQPDDVIFAELDQEKRDNDEVLTRKSQIDVKRLQ